MIKKEFSTVPLAISSLEGWTGFKTLLNSWWGDYNFPTSNNENNKTVNKGPFHKTAGVFHLYIKVVYEIIHILDHIELQHIIFVIGILDLKAWDVEIFNKKIFSFIY